MRLPPAKSDHKPVTNTMGNAAEAFDSFFKAGHVPGYRQRDDLSRFHPTVRDQLSSLQESWNVALSNSRRDVPGHADTQPFHLDFVDADEKNATAFCYDGHALIALTVPLIFALSDICLALSKSQEAAVVLGIQYVADDYNQLHAVLFSMISAFIGEFSARLYLALLRANSEWKSHRKVALLRLALGRRCRRACPAVNPTRPQINLPLAALCRFGSIGQSPERARCNYRWQSPAPRH